nr:hypothetical protein [Rickettsia endosymbiont of Ceutorhynchus assimilis]
MTPPVLSKADKDVKKRINTVARNIRKKYLSLKLEKSNEDEALDRLLNPITGPLNKLVEKSRKQPKNDEVFVDNASEDDLQQSIREQTPSYVEFIKQYPEIAQDYVLKYLIGSNETDSTYGLKYNAETGSWTMGTERVDFLPNGDINVGNITYPKSRGLYDLLFLKHPRLNTQKDNEQFNEIVSRTNAHRRQYKPTGQIKGANSKKYQNFIKPYATTTTTATPKQSKSHKKSLSGSGLPILSSSSSPSLMMQYNEKPKQYVYYDDVNELIDRLIILDASQEAGNGNHTNEILSILEELRELRVIIY